MGNLRTARRLEEGMCISDEPNCCFNEIVLKKAYDNPNISKYLNKEEVGYKKFSNKTYLS